MGARGGLIVMLAGLAGAVPVVFACYAIQASVRSDAAAETATLAAELLAGSLDVRGSDPAADQEELARLTRAGDEVCWLGVMRPDRSVLEVARQLPVPRETIIAQIDPQATRPLSQEIAIPGQLDSAIRLSQAPLPNGRGVIATAVRQPARTELGLALWLCGCGAAAIVGLWLVGQAFGRLILRPQREFRQRLHALYAELVQGPGSDASAAEVAEPLAALRGLEAELKRWRREAASLRHSVDARVETKTRSVKQALRAVESDAGTDPLSRLGNRRALDRDLPIIFEQHKRRGAELSVAVIDLNNLKATNDTVGHEGGDELIVGLGDAVRGSIRKHVDLAARYGGDEFVLVFPGTTSAAVATIIERLGALFHQRIRKFAHLRPRPGLSVGIASLREHGAEKAEDLLRMADEAMYEAKRGARLHVTAGVRRLAQGQ